MSNDREYPPLDLAPLFDDSIGDLADAGPLATANNVGMVNRGDWLPTFPPGFSFTTDAKPLGGGKYEVTLTARCEIARDRSE